MFKRILSLILTAVMLLSLASCASKGDKVTTTEPGTTPEATTPEVTTPEVTTPEVTTPEVTTPEVTTPEVTTPEDDNAVKVGDVFDFVSDFGKSSLTDFFSVIARHKDSKQLYTDFTYHDGSDESIKSATHATPMIGYRVDGVNNAVFYSKSDENHILKWYPQNNTETRVVFTAPADGTYSYEMGAHGIWDFNHSSSRYYAEANGTIIHDAKYPQNTSIANSMTSFKGSAVLLKGQTLVFVYDPEDSYAGDNSYFDAFRVTYTSTDTTGATVTPPADENKNEWSLKTDLSSATQGPFSFVYAIDRPQTLSSPFTPQVKDGKLVTIIGNDADATKDGEPVFYIENGVIHANLAYYGREDQLSFGITFQAPEDGEYTFTVKWIRDSAGTNWNQRFVWAGDSWVVNNVAMGTALNVDTYSITLKKNEKIHISSTCGGADSGKAVIEMREFTVKLNEKVDFTPEDQNNPIVDFEYENELAPIWTGNTVYDEVIMLVGKNDAAPLLYPATEIISITNFTGTKTFVQGVDYVYENGMIKMPAGSSLTYCPETTYWKKHSYDVYTYNADGVLAMTMAGPGNTLPQYQLKVTYKHNATSNISVPDKSETFKDVIAKLEKGEDVTIIFFGDSITEGWDNTLKSNLDPFLPPWSALVVQYLADKYDYAINYVDQDRSVVTGAWNYPTKYRVSFGDRGTIYYINTAVGGYTAQTALDKFNTHVSQQIDRYGCDLIFYAFGMNTGGQTAAGFASQAKTFSERLFAKAPDAKLVIVSSMLPNTEGKNDSPVKDQEEALIPVVKALQDAGRAVELAPLQSVHKVLDSVKRFRETSGNNMNHPGDYLHRIYAQVALETICGYSKDYK